MIDSKNHPDYRQCTYTVMDNIADPDITFDEKGICNYYYQYHELANRILVDEAHREQKLERLIASIKKDGKGKPYDCITGISGGVDSSYLILLAKRWGLRTLIVHFDNGWNTETAVKNIDNIIKKTGFDLITLVVNWEEFRDLQLAYIRSNVVDLEVPTDHAIAATWYKWATKYKIKTILSGGNIVTEAIMPKTWNYSKIDYVNLINIHKQFGTTSFKTYPVYGFMEQFKSFHFGKTTTATPLNLVDYNKDKVKEEIKKELDWVDYGGKHYESFFTKFYQAHILPEKYKIDKRKAHLSNLILSKQITREEALAELEKPLYDPKELERDTEYFIKKLQISREEFDEIMNQPRVDHSVYGKQQSMFEKYALLRLLNPVYRAIKK
jgi:N-acetyl sugar amidotransferase